MQTPPDGIGEARTVILRLRRDMESNTWRGQALCIQTGAVVPMLLSEAPHAPAQLMTCLLQLLATPPEAEPPDHAKE